MTRPTQLAIGMASMGLVGALALGFVLLVAVVVVAFVATRPPHTPIAAKPVAPIAAPRVEVPVAPPAAALTAAPEALNVRIESDPSGADVTEEGVLVGNTPFDVRVFAETPRTLSIGAPGHTAKAVRVDGSNATMLVRLDVVARPSSTPKAAEVVVAAPVTPPPVVPPKVATPPKTVAGDLKDPFAQ